MKVVLSLVIVLSMAVVVSCSSSQKEGPKPREFKKDYKVLDASKAIVPTWIEEPQKWAQKNDPKAKKNRYYVSDTDLIKNRRLCMKSAEAQATAKVAGELTQFIKGSYAQAIEGNSSDEVETYMEETLAQEIQSFIVGARVYRTYWEKRFYKEDLGAEEDKRGFVCSALIRVDEKIMKKALKNALKKVEGQVKDSAEKEKAQEAIKEVEKKFEELG